MSFDARYDGWCETCATPIRKGERIRYGDDKSIEHDDCSPAPIPRRTEVVCSDCWLVMPCECDR